MEYLQLNTKWLLDFELRNGNDINAKGKDDIVIGGGDTGTAVCHGTQSVTNIELLPQPLVSRGRASFRTEYGHNEVAANFD